MIAFSKYADLLRKKVRSPQVSESNNSPSRGCNKLYNTNTSSAFGFLPSLYLAQFDVAVDRLKRFPYFSEEDYLKLNPDVISMDRFVHLLAYGAHEYRQVVRPQLIAKRLGEMACASPSSVKSIFCSEPEIETSLNVNIYYNSAGNSFMKEIALGLYNSIQGYFPRIRLLDENSNNDEDEDSDINIVVAPHEFFLLGPGAKKLSPDFVRRLVCFNTEQPQTHWFWKAVPYCLLGRGVLDLSPYNAKAFSEVMPAARFFPATQPDFGTFDEWVDHPLVMSRSHLFTVGQAPYERLTFRERKLDLAFFGAESKARVDFFTRNARFFSDFETTIYIRGDHRMPQDRRLSAVAANICSQSKLTLSIHRDEFGYLEWHRMVWQGMGMGGVVVSDTCLPDPDFLSGEHFFMDSARHLPDLIEWVLREPDGQQKAEEMQVRNLRRLAGPLGSDSLAAQLVKFLGRLA